MLTRITGQCVLHTPGFQAPAGSNMMYKRSTWAPDLQRDLDLLHSIRLINHELAIGHSSWYLHAPFH
jgi:hypothetical protein